MGGELSTYWAKRNFKATPEPAGRKGRARQQSLAYLIQRHAATRLHYDLRLEHQGVLKSWAVTKAPSRDPAVKRLAVEVEDHPLDYGRFEGTIPEGNYGAGTVQLWDRGHWVPQDDDLEAAFRRGVIKLRLEGERLKGGWALIRLKSDRGKPAKRANWLFVKEIDDHAVPGEGDALAEIDSSIASGRSLAEIAGRAPGKSRLRTPARPRRTSARAAASPPGFLPIQLCTLVDRPPSQAGWVHEIKFDGYRLQASVGSDGVRLFTRRGHDWTDRFPELAQALADWPPAVLDGELCALNDGQAPDFSALQAALADGRTEALVYFAFDLLSEDGRDLRDQPLEARKARLKAWLAARKPADRIRYVEHFASTGQAVLDSACRMDLEGIISKRLEAPYRAGRSAGWVKSKCRGRDEVVIGGWTSRDGRFRSLLVGVRQGQGQGLRYLGRVGTGYGAERLKPLLPALKAAAAQTSPFAGPGAPRGGRDIHWLEPRLVAEIEHGGYTDSGALRQAAFKGLREDKPAEEVTEPPVPPPPGTPPSASPSLPARTAAPARRGRTVIEGVSLSNADKVLWPATARTPALTKADLAEFYVRVAPRLLPHVAERPVSIIRAPDGISGERFFQRHAMAGSSPRLKLIEVEARKPYVTVTDAGGLVALAQAGGLELHPWGCRPGDPETPDQLTFDLDPDEGLSFARVIDAALEVREQLQALGLDPFVKTTGGKGLHLVVPIRSDGRSRVDWPTAKALAKAVCELIRQEAPDRFTTTLAKAARGGKVFLDYLRNGRMATAVAPWSPRARPGAPFACPLGWSEVGPGLEPLAFNLVTAAERLEAPDPWADFRKAEVSLRPLVKRLGL